MTVKTPIKRTSIPNKLNIKAFCIYLIESQLIRIQIGIRIVVKTMKTMEIPSAPNII
jgi:hypothetical protein